MDSSKVSAAFIHINIEKIRATDELVRQYYQCMHAKKQHMRHHLNLHTHHFAECSRPRDVSLTDSSRSAARMEEEDGMDVIDVPTDRSFRKEPSLP